MIVRVGQPFKRLVSRVCCSVCGEFAKSSRSTHFPDDGGPPVHMISRPIVQCEHFRERGTHFRQRGIAQIHAPEFQYDSWRNS